MGFNAGDKLVIEFTELFKDTSSQTINRIGFRRLRFCGVVEEKVDRLGRARELILLNFGDVVHQHGLATGWLPGDPKRFLR